MKNFFKTFGAALLAFVVGTVLMVIVTFGFFAGLTASLRPSQPAVPDGAVLRIDFRTGIVNSPDNRIGTIDVNRMEITMPNTLLEAVQAIQLAAADPRISGICIDLDNSGTVSLADLEEIRAELIKFKESGKFVWAYGNVYSQTGYWFASAADRVYMNPEGLLDWRGIAANVMFYKGLLDKLGVEVQVIRHGSFKSAVEPYIMDHMSPANRLQMETLVDALWETLVSDVAASRPGHTPAEWKQYAATMAVATPEDARRLGFVDDLLYRDQFDALLLAEHPEVQAPGRKEAATVQQVALDQYIAANLMAMHRMSHNRVALIYADGQIVDGESGRNSVGGAMLADQIALARRDDQIKAVVLRVNSPGGSALASEVIWREVELCREQKPVIVSMGSMAASGGYYISSGADVILADRVTQTGSIGVFGMVPNLQKTLRDKVGINVDVVRTNASADMGSVVRPLSTDERTYLQNQVERTYRTFVDHVADGRNMTFDQVDAIGQGRVWLGVNARENGLVDGFGGLSDALALAVDRAGIGEDFEIREIVSEPTPFGTLLSMFSTQARTDRVLQDELGVLFRPYLAMRQLLGQTGVLARMPYEVTFE